jgi:hypothetical protein
MIKRPAVFNGYIAADPSIYWNNPAVVAEAESFLAHTKSLHADFYITVAGAPGDIPKEFARLRAALAKSAPKGFRWSFEAMKDQDHMSIASEYLSRLGNPIRGLEIDECNGTVRQGRDRENPQAVSRGGPEIWISRTDHAALHGFASGWGFNERGAFARRCASGPAQS